MAGANTLVFSSGPGRVVAMPGIGIPLNLTIGDIATKQGGWGGFSAMMAIVTKIGLREGVKAQFTETLQDRIYVYTFGDSLGDIVISGIALSAVCVDGKVLDSGFERVYRYYRNFRLSRTGLPVAISIGASIHLLGFLLGVDLLHQDPENGMAQFTLVFKYAPQQDAIGLVGDGDGGGDAGGGGFGDGGGDAGGGGFGDGGGDTGGIGDAGGGGWDIISNDGGNTGGDVEDVLTGSGSAAFSSTANVSGTLHGATFSDTNTASTPGDFTTEIDWGDGNAKFSGLVSGSAGSFTVDGSHVYTADGEYLITVSVDCSRGNSITITGKAKVGSSSSLSASSRIGLDNTGFVGDAP